MLTQSTAGALQSYTGWTRESLRVLLLQLCAQPKPLPQMHLLNV
jgi:hypothetical protein